MKVEVTNPNPGVMFGSLPDRSLFVHCDKVYIKTKVVGEYDYEYDAIQLDSREEYTFHGTNLVHPVKGIKVEY